MTKDELIKLLNGHEWNADGVESVAGIGTS